MFIILSSNVMKCFCFDFIGKFFFYLSSMTKLDEKEVIKGFILYPTKDKRPKESEVAPLLRTNYSIIFNKGIIEDGDYPKKFITPAQFAIYANKAKVLNEILRIQCLKNSAGIDVADVFIPNKDVTEAFRFPLLHLALISDRYDCFITLIDFLNEIKYPKMSGLINYYNENVPLLLNIALSAYGKNTKSLSYSYFKDNYISILLENGARFEMFYDKELKPFHNLADEICPIYYCILEHDSQFKLFKKFFKFLPNKIRTVLANNIHRLTINHPITSNSSLQSILSVVSKFSDQIPKVSNEKINDINV